jgi:ATP-binding cassette subfamily G (WHITE) protein 2
MIRILSSPISVDSEEGQVSTSLLDINDASDEVTLSFDEINYTIGESTKVNVISQLVSFCRSTASKQILFNVSGEFKAGMNAILGMIGVEKFNFLFERIKCESISRTLGPTGCGKSTLLDILANRRDRRGFSGNVFVSESCRPSPCKSVIGYVVQDGKRSHKVNSLSLH